MGSALEWYRVEVCEKEGHDHGPEGELECLLEHYHELKARAD